MGFRLQIPLQSKPFSQPNSINQPRLRFPNVLSSIFTPQFTTNTNSIPRTATNSCSVAFRSTPISIFSTNFPAPLLKFKPQFIRRPNSSRPSKSAIRAASSSREEEEETPAIASKSSTKSILICSIITAVLGVGNRVLHKLALVPLKEYPFFLAQFITFGYVAIYLSILFVRHRAGIVTNEMLAIPKSRFVVIGFLEALGVAASMSAVAMLPGPAVPLLNQTFLVWQLLLSSIMLGKRYSFRQIVGCFLVATGVVLAVSSGSGSGQMLSGVSFIWPTLMIAASAVQAAASIIKEFVFVDAAKRLKGKSLDIFVVNSFGSTFQALFVLLFLPFLSNMKGIPFTELPQYLKSGAACFLNVGESTTGCDGAPLIPLLYVTNNIAFNISVLNLLKISSAVVSSLVVMVSVPIAIYVLSLPLPYLPEGASLTPFFLLGSVVLMAGLILYNLPLPRPSKKTS